MVLLSLDMTELVQITHPIVSGWELQTLVEMQRNPAVFIQQTALLLKSILISRCQFRLVGTAEIIWSMTLI